MFFLNISEYKFSNLSYIVEVLTFSLKSQTETLMKNISSDGCEEIVDSLSDGSGYVCLPRVGEFSPSL